jgi:hypothetical protein
MTAEMDEASGVSAAVLERECALFLRYLAGRDPDADVRAAYARAHRTAEGATAEWAVDAGEDPLVAFARRGVLAARLVDPFAAVVDRGGAFRRKLLLVLECLAAEPEPEPLRPAGWSLGDLIRQAVLATLTSILTFAVACVVLGPMWLVARRGEDAS